MALSFRTKRIQFDPSKGLVHNEPGSVNFGKKVKTAQAAINGYSIGYTDGDHHILRTMVEIEGVDVKDEVVDFRVKMLFRDSSGNIDDRYDGWVDVLVIADLA